MHRSIKADEQPSPHPRYPLMQAMRRDNPKDFRCILERTGWPVDSAWSDYELLQAAIDLRRRRIVNVLLRLGCRVAKDGSAAKMLHQVVKLGWLDVVRNFLERGARVYDQDSEGNTALHVAFRHGATDGMLELLLERYGEETSFNAENAEGLSVWHVMCAGPRHDFVERALRCRIADVNSKVSLKSTMSFAGYTALHFAVQYNRLEIARHLLESNANIYAKDSSGSTPLHLACKLRNVEMIDLIFSYDMLNDNVENHFGLSHFMCACAGSDASVVKDFLDTAASQAWTCPKALVTSRVKEAHHYPLAGYTPLHFAAEFGHYDTVQLLLSYEPPCCTVNLAKLTPVALASKEEHQKVFFALLRYCVNYKTNGKRQANASRFGRSKPYPTVVKNNSGGYQVPDSWFIRRCGPQEYPRYVSVKGRWGVIPIYAPRPGVKYHVALKIDFKNRDILSYFVL